MNRIEILLPTNTIDRRFAAFDLQQEEGAEEPERSYERNVAPHLDRLTPQDADILELRFLRGMHQEQIGRIFGIVQSSVSRRITALCKLVRVISSLPAIDAAQAERDLHDLMAPELIKAFCAVAEPHSPIRTIADLHSPSRASSKLGIRAQIARRRWTRARRILLSTTAPNLEPYRVIAAAGVVRKRRVEHGSR